MNMKIIKLNSTLYPLDKINQVNEVFENNFLVTSEENYTLITLKDKTMNDSVLLEFSNYLLSILGD
jgi:type III secretory pathway lipoprotein EscJ